MSLRPWPSLDWGFRGVRPGAITWMVHVLWGSALLASYPLAKAQLGSAFMVSSSVASSASSVCISTIPTGTGRASRGDRSADPCLLRQSLLLLADQLWDFWLLPDLSMWGLQCAFAVATGRISSAPLHLCWLAALLLHGCDQVRQDLDW